MGFLGLCHTAHDLLLDALQKPIYLRYICLFYLSHIPTFLDIHLCQLFGEPHTEPEEFRRGIDPNVDNPTQCHDHSDVPQNDEDWPSLDSILSFKLCVRERLVRVYDDLSSGKIRLTRNVARVLFMTYKHEGLHLETLPYMLIQQAGSGTIPPPWDVLVASWNTASKPASSAVVIEAPRSSGDNDPIKSFDVNGHVFGWDSESLKWEVAVDAFRIEWKLITNWEFFEFYKRAAQGIDDLDINLNTKLKNKLTFPASWVVTASGEIQVRTLYGPVPMKIARDWPVITTYDNLSAYAIVKGGRIPTEPESLVFRDKFVSGYESGANMGFRNWHPVPCTTGLEDNGRKGHNGGVAEWTSTLWDRYDGVDLTFPTIRFSADFFDGVHNTTLGGSYAMIPRIADRRSFRNWWQRNYPFCWAGARVAYELN
ncbi:C-type lectin protein [Scleroderma citrinum]